MTLHVCTDKQRLDVALIHDYLSTQAYWSEGIPRETVQRAIDGSTRDAHGLYARFGFAAPARPELLMDIARPTIYQDAAAAALKD